MIKINLFLQPDLKLFSPQYVQRVIFAVSFKPQVPSNAIYNFKLSRNLTQQVAIDFFKSIIPKLLQIAESRVTRQLTAEEKEKYGVLDWDWGRSSFKQ